MTSKNKSRKLGVWMPRKIQKETRLSWREKCLFAYFYSFGSKGCWATNIQIGLEWGRSAQTIKMIISNLDKAGLLHIAGGKSKYRRIWCKEHPAFLALQREYASQKAAEEKKSLLVRNRTGTNKCEKSDNRYETVPVEVRNRTGDQYGTVPVLIKITNKSTNKCAEAFTLARKEASEGSAEATKDEKLRHIKLEWELEQKKKKLFRPAPKSEPLSEGEYALRVKRQKTVLGITS